MSKAENGRETSMFKHLSVWVSRHPCGLWSTGAALIGVHLVIAFISPEFLYGGNPAERPVLVLAGLEILGGIIYLAACSCARQATATGKLLLWMIAVGIILRTALIVSTPILEDDYYRYLWDGAVVARGINPYSYAPIEVLTEDREDSSVPETLFELAKQSGPVISRVNHPKLRTIYPPVAQAAFASAYVLSPWSILAWRLVLLVFDIAVLGILILTLRSLCLPLSWLMIYWWNPLLIKETVNSGHMDVIILPFVLGAVLLANSRKFYASAVCLALAMGTKIWPVILLPFILRPLFANPRRLAIALFLFSLIGGMMIVPVYAGGLDSTSGFVAYSQEWEINDALFMAIAWSSKLLLGSIGMFAGQGQLAARAVVVLLILAWLLWLCRPEIGGGSDLYERCLFAVAAVFLLSPAQFPWYYIWVIPFLAIRPRMSLLLLTVMLPLYYLRFYFAARDKVGVFDYGIVWLEFMPVWALLIREWYITRYRTSITPPEITVQYEK